MTMLAFLPGGWEIWVILFIALLLFAHRIPGMARSLGSGIVEFKKGLKGDEGESKQITQDSITQDSITKGSGSKGEAAPPRQGEHASSGEGSKG